MFEGKELGRAIGAAIALKGVTQRQVAHDFGVSQPSVSEWVSTGRIRKGLLTMLFSYFANEVGPTHWGFPTEWWGPSLSPRALRLARLYESLPDDEKERAYALAQLALQPRSAASPPPPSDGPTRTTPLLPAPTRERKRVK